MPDFLDSSDPARARNKIGAASPAEVPPLVTAALAKDDAPAQAAATAVANAVNDLELVQGKTFASEADYIGAIVDVNDDLLMLFNKNGTIDDFQEVVFERLDWESDWIVVFTDVNNKVLSGWRVDGTFVDYTDSNTGVPDVSVYPAVAPGDSTTWGADLPNPTAERWTTKLSALLGKTIENFGSSGARAEEIIARQGGISFTCSVTGNQIPASGPVVLTNMELDPVRSGDVASYTVEIAGVRGVLARSESDRTFTRSNPGTAVAVPAVVDVYAAEGFGAHQPAAMLFLGMGINNEGMIGSGDQTVAQLCSWYTAATSSLTPLRPRYVIWGMLDRGPSEAVGTINGDIIAEVEEFLAKTYGSDFVNVRKYLSSYRALAEAGITPTANDDAAIAVKTVPPSLRVSEGSVHLNAAGHQIMASLFHRHLTRKGWI